MLNSQRTKGHQPIHRRLMWVLWKYRLTGALILIILTGCAGLKEKFVHGTKANVGLFADNTIAMLSDVDLSIDRNEAVFVRRFIDESDPEEKRMIQLNDNMQIALYNIVDYSITLVSMAESDRTEKERVSFYADHLTRFKEDILYSVKMTPEHFDIRIEQIKGEPDFLAALRSAQPLISAAVIDAIRELKALTDAIEVVANKIDAKIDAEYGDIIRYQQKMEGEKARILRAIEMIFDAYRTDRPDLSGLIDNAVIWFPELIPRDRPTPKDLKAIGDHLQARLNALHTIQQEIKPYWDEYRDAHRELDDLTDKTLKQVNHVRLILLVWVRAHQKMATGTVDPAEWFDINTAPVQLLKLGSGLL